MKCPILLLLAVSAALVVIPAGCNKAPPPPPVVETPPPPLPPPTPASVVARLTQPETPAILPHKIEPQTEFPQSIASLAPAATAPKVDAPPADDKTIDPNRPPTKGLTADGVTTDLVMHDWTGIVLVPLDTSVSRAHTVLVTLDRIEAHPLENGQVRIWARIRNISDGKLSTEVACSFRTAESPEPERPIFYGLDIPHSTYRDVFFVSPEGRNLNSYTVLVRTGDDTISGSGTLK
ncbi:MAG TPA: hypothetical protein VNW23_05265 [Opitutaceae bacterium]|jgi:hypothetical protein|nr:hypothetical protein [Opitutaceae bacterium]